jgi:hypothetical protein
MKKMRGRKSRATVPLNVISFFISGIHVGVEFSQIYLNPLATLFSGFLKASGELQTGFLKLSKDCGWLF